MRKLLSASSFVLLLLLATAAAAEAISAADFVELCENGSLEEIKKVVTEGVNVNKADGNGRFPIIAAVHNKDAVEVIRFLTSSKCYIDSVEKSTGITALLEAFFIGADDELIEEILRHRTNVNVKTKELGLTPLMLAVTAQPQHRKQPSLRSVEMLLAAGAKVNHVADNGINVLLQAMLSHAPDEITELLLQKGADPNYANRDGVPILITMLQSRLPLPTVRLLLKYGADVNGRDPKGATPLSCAITSKNEDAARLLLTAGADVNQPAEEGITPLMFAVEYSSPELVSALLTAGAQTRPDGVYVLDVTGINSGDRTEVVNIIEDADRAYLKANPLQWLLVNLMQKRFYIYALLAIAAVICCMFAYKRKHAESE